jgi:hypothetical protein
MDPALLIPTPDAIPVAWGWFQLLLLLTLFCHILLMNVMVGTTFIALINHLGCNGGSTPCTAEISQKLPFTIAFAVNFGVAPYLFLQVLYGHFLYVSSILMAVSWLSIVALLICAYYLSYVYKYKYTKMAESRVLVCGLTTLLFLVIAFFFVNNMTLMQLPSAWSRYFDHPGGQLLNLADPTLFPRYLHFMISAVAVGGLAIAAFFTYKQKKGVKDAQPWIEYGCQWFGFATLLNFAIGLWFLAALPKGILTTSTPTGMFFLVALSGGIALSIPALIYGFTARITTAIPYLLGTIALMLYARSLLRTAMLAPVFSVSQLPVSPSYTPFLFFLLFLAGGLVLIAWMLRLTFRSSTEKEVQP